MGELFRICTRLELRWTFYILLDAMEKALGGVSSAAILRWFHKDALDAFMVSYLLWAQNLLFYSGLLDLFVSKIHAEFSFFSS